MIHGINDIIMKNYSDPKIFNTMQSTTNLNKKINCNATGTVTVNMFHLNRSIYFIRANVKYSLNEKKA